MNSAVYADHHASFFDYVTPEASGCDSLVIVAYTRHLQNSSAVFFTSFSVSQNFVVDSLFSLYLYAFEMNRSPLRWCSLTLIQLMNFDCLNQGFLYGTSVPLITQVSKSVDCYETRSWNK